jgi:sialate O-acetylesterase
LSAGISQRDISPLFFALNLGDIVLALPWGVYMKLTSVCILAGLALIGLLPQAHAVAAVKVSSMFTDHLVLQRDMADPVWGQARPGEKITVQFAGQKISTTADRRGNWMAKLAALKASATPRELTVSSGKAHIVFHDVLVGEVWLCSGQSNMQYPMMGWFHRTNLAAALAAGTHGHIRLYHVPMIESNFTGHPRKTAPAAWHRCTPKNLAGFTAVGYFFGLNLHRKLGVPVGLIEADWGGTNIEPWIPAAGYFAVPQLKTDRTWLRAMDARQQQLDQRYINTMANWLTRARAAVANGRVLPRQPGKPMDAISSPHAFDYHIPPHDWQPDAHQNPTTLFNGMINPLIPYAIRGAIWYQGENNVSSHDHLYYYHLKALIGGWRKLWHQGNFPFYIVQIAPFNYGHDGPMEPLIWRAEERAARRIANCSIASTMDIGNIHNIHPADKSDVGYRLALIALAKTYHHAGLVYSGPQFTVAKFKGSAVVIHFQHLGGGLASRNGKALNWFDLAGGNGKFFPATAVISGNDNTVVVRSQNVPAPVAVRFAWSDIAVPNLMNKAGLPALPFQARKP